MLRKVMLLNTSISSISRNSSQYQKSLFQIRDGWERHNKAMYILTLLIDDNI